MTQFNIQETTQADVNAIADTLHQLPQLQNVTTTVTFKDNYLKILLESGQVPEQNIVVSLIRNQLSTLNFQSCKKVKIYGREAGEDFPDWQEEFDLEEQINLSLPLSETDITALNSISTELKTEGRGLLPKEPSRLELAKQGDSQAITDVLNYLLQSRNTTVAANLKDGYLQILLQADRIPEQEQSVAYICKFITQLQIEPLKKIKLCGKRKGGTFLAWSQEIELQKPQIEQTSVWGSIFGAVAGAAGVVSGAAVQAGGVVTGAVVGTAGAIGGTAIQAGGVVTGAVVGTAEAVGGTAIQASQAVVGTAVGVGGAIAGAVSQTPEGLGHLINLVDDSPMLQQLTKALPIDWLLNLINQVDIVKAETHVKQLQQKYPQEQPNEIAHRLMLEKSVYVGGSGLASSLVPGFAAALFAADLAATTAIQAEMVYQIACAYGFDLKEPARKGELLTIFGVSLGGGQALKAGASYATKAGAGLLRNIPFAGAVIGASTNAAMLYAVGHGACQFYEAKLNQQNAQACIAAARIESNKYLEEAIAQEVIMDQILVHIILAGNPGKTWEQILPELQTLNISPASLEVMATNIKSPPSLDTLLNQINSDFAVSLATQCNKIAQLDGVITSAEAKVLETIINKFEIDFKVLQ